jgi:type IV pilus assembly protein PilN
VILFNLLPHRELARKRRRDVFNLSLGGSALAGVLIAGLVYLWIQGQTTDQQQKNQILQGEIKVLEQQIKDIAKLEAEIAALRARQQAVEDLQADRNLPVHLLNELARQVPDGVTLVSVKQEGQLVTLQGMAQSNERVSELLRNLAHNTRWLTKPELVEIVAANLTLEPRDLRRVSNFTLRVRLLRPSEAQAAAAAASAASVAQSPASTAATLPKAAPPTPAARP